MRGLDWQLRDQCTVFEGGVQILRREFVLPDGTSTTWDVLAPARMVAVIALTGEERFLVIRQFRAGPMRVLDELPGGYLEPDESVSDAARRELFEETGYVSETLTHIGDSWVAPDAALLMHAVIASGCTRAGGGAPGDDESGAVRELALDDFVELVRSGALTDQASAYRALDVLQQLGIPGKR